MQGKILQKWVHIPIRIATVVERSHLDEGIVLDRIGKAGRPAPPSACPDSMILIDAHLDMDHLIVPSPKGKHPAVRGEYFFAFLFKLFPKHVCGPIPLVWENADTF